jgi:Tfp pilus assembly protein PilF
MFELKKYRGWMAGLIWPLTGLASAAQPPVTVSASPASTLEIRSLIQAGRLPEASREITRQLQKQDPDPAVQLLQCVVQANQNQTDKAIACFTALIKTRPDMVEAYNNLGVLLASQGQHEEAKRWFHLAMQRMPSMWTVHQNLLSLQAEISRKAYARALQAELPVKEAPIKLTLLAATTLAQAPKPEAPVLADAKLAANAPVQPPVQSSIQRPVVAAKEAASPTPTTTVASAPAATKPPLADAALLNSMPAKPAGAPVTPPPAAKPKTETIEAKALEPVKPESPKIEAIDDETRRQLQTAVEAWAKAWSSQDMPAYLAAYSPEFSTAKWSSRAQWEAERTARIVGRQFVSVTVSHFTFEKLGQKMLVRFNQAYKSDNIVSTNRKRLDMALQEGRWQIVKENVIGN